MFKPKIDHITLTVKDMEKSRNFYKSLFVDFLGYSIYIDTYELFMIDCSDGFMFEITPEDPQFSNDEFNKNRVGLHHFGITLENKLMVDGVYNKLQELDAQILDAPSYYPEYSENYYAVYFTDPNGFKMEFLSL